MKKTINWEGTISGGSSSLTKFAVQYAFLICKIDFAQQVYIRWPVMGLYQEAGPEQNNWAIKFYLRRKLAGGIRLSPVDTPAENLVSYSIFFDYD